MDGIDEDMAILRGTRRFSMPARAPREGKSVTMVVVGMRYISEVPVLPAFQHAKDERNKYEKHTHH